MTALQAAAPVTTFDRYHAAAGAVIGWFNPLSIALWDTLLTRQRAAKLNGDILEIGVWQGKSAGMLAAHTRPGETLRLVDIYIHENLKANLESFGTAFQCDIEFNRSDSFAFFTADYLAKHRRSFRFIHVDGHHVAHAISDDINHASQLLAADGLLVIDDFCNDRFPQVTEITYRFLERHADEFAMFLCGGNKAYLTRVRAYQAHYDFINSPDFKTEMKKRGLTVETYPASACQRPIISVYVPQSA